MTTTGRKQSFFAIFLVIYIDDDHYKEAHKKKNMQEQEKEINLVFEPEENWILLRQGRRGRKSLTHKFVSSFDGFTFSTKIQGCESRIYNNIEFCQKSRTTMSNFGADKLELLGFAPVFSTVFFLWLFQLIRRPNFEAISVNFSSVDQPNSLMILMRNM